VVTLQELRQFTGLIGRGHPGSRAWPKVTKKAKGLEIALLWSPTVAGLATSNKERQMPETTLKAAVLRLHSNTSQLMTVFDSIVQH